MTPEIQTKTSNAKISEALELLNEAAIEKKDELTHLMSNRYAHIREAMTTTITQGKEKALEIASDVDKRVHKDPWIYIGGAAAASLLIGYLMGSRRK